MGKAMSLKDIEKLKERVDKDPNSKLFVPLAEEYKKEGMIEEAISVLLNGIERQPGYMSARVSLGKIYLEKGMMKEARSDVTNRWELYKQMAAIQYKAPEEKI